MDDHLSKAAARSLAVRDRRYSIRHPFAADVEFLDLESGVSGSGVTSDLSMGGCFVCTSKTLMLASRTKITLTRKDSTVQALAVVRIVKGGSCGSNTCLTMVPASVAPDLATQG